MRRQRSLSLSLSLSLQILSFAVIAASSAESWAAIDCTATCSDPGELLLGAGGVNSSVYTGTIKVDPDWTQCVNSGAGWGALPAGTISIGNLNGKAGCDQVCGVHGTLDFTSVPNYAPAVNINSVQCIRGSLRVINTDIAIFGAQVLTAIGDDIVFQSNSGLAAINVDALVTANGAGISTDIVLNSNPGLTDVSFASLDALGGTLQISGNNALPNLALGFPVLTSIGNALKITANAALDLILGEFPLLTTIGGVMTVSGNNSMTTLIMPALVGVAFIPGGGILISSNNLVALDLSGLVFLGAGLSIIAEPNLMDAGIVPLNLAAVGGTLSFSNNPSLDDLDAFASIGAIGTDLFIDSNDALTNIGGISAVAGIGGNLTVRGNDSLPTVSFPNLPNVGRVELRSNNQLTNVAFPALTLIRTELYIFGNLMLPDIGVTNVGFPLLATIGTQIYLHANSFLSAFTLPALSGLGWRAWVKYNPNLAAWPLPAVLVPGPSTAIGAANGPGFCTPFGNWATAAGAAPTCTP
jgi:hypothetical protein